MPRNGNIVFFLKNDFPCIFCKRFSSISALVLNTRYKATKTIKVISVKLFKRMLAAIIITAKYIGCLKYL